VDRYRDAQVARNERITDWVIDELDRVASAGARDRLFVIHGVWADLRFADLALDPSDRAPGCYAGDPARANAGVLGIGRTNTLRTWLAMWSLRESQCRGAPHLGRIDVPSLVIQSTSDRGVFPNDARAIHEAIGADDNELRFVPGEHYFESGGRNHVAELIAEWTSVRAR
jgi:pimeloyl-ACP methyl ester carboxylesterase